MNAPTRIAACLVFAATSAAAQAQGTAYVSSEKDDALTLIDTQTLAVKGTIPICKRGRHIQRLPDGDDAQPGVQPAAAGVRGEPRRALLPPLPRREATTGGGGVLTEPLPRVEHALTHFDWVLHPRRALLPQAAAEPGLPGCWVAREALSQYALPAPLKKLLG